jgi:hypothetical protein
VSQQMVGTTPKPQMIIREINQLFKKLFDNPVCKLLNINLKTFIVSSESKIGRSTLTTFNDILFNLYLPLTTFIS